MNKRHEQVHVTPSSPIPERVQAKRYSDGECKPHKVSGWRKASGFDPRVVFTGSVIGASGWVRRGILAISALELAEAPDGSGEAIDQWHISMSSSGPKRCTDEEVRQTLACFGLTGAEEDNHHPGIARHFWMPVDSKRRRDCECKVTEQVVTEPDGYKWSTPKDACHGCDYEALMDKVGESRPCPIHKPSSTVAIVGAEPRSAVYERQFMQRELLIAHEAVQAAPFIKPPWDNGATAEDIKADLDMISGGKTLHDVVDEEFPGMRESDRK